MKQRSKRSWLIVTVLGLVLLLPAFVNVEGRSLYSLLLEPPKTPAAPEPPAATRDGRWRQDLAYLAKELPRLHLDPFRTTPKATFDALVSNLDARIPKLSDSAVTVELMRIVSSLKDGHTRMYISDSFTGYPFALQWFRNDLQIVGSSRGFEDLLGAKVLKIGNATPREALEQLRPVLSFETEADFVLQSADALRRPQVLAAIGVQDDENRGRMELQLSSGTIRQSGFDSSFTGFSNLIGSGLLFQQRAQEPHWVSYLPDSDTIYVRYKSCEDQTGFERLTNVVLEDIKTRPAKRIVIDLRGNGGGNNGILPTLIGALKTTRLNAKGAVFAAIDAGTFSSGADAVEQLRESLPVIVFGTSTGGSINGFGEVRPLTLANSGLRLQYSTKYFDLQPGKIGGYEPDVRVEPTLEAWQQGRDPVLEAILAWKP